MSYRSYITRFAEFPAVSLLFRGWVGGWVGVGGGWEEELRLKLISAWLELAYSG